MGELRGRSERKISAQAVLAELEAVLSSPSFQRSPQLSAFLRYCVEQTLAGRGEELKEYSIATDVFGRGEAFDPSNDTIVRVQAGRMRLRLSEYYEHAGNGAAVRIQVPKGGYVAEFQSASPDKPNGEHAEAPRHGSAPPQIRTRRLELGGALGLTATAILAVVILTWAGAAPHVPEAPRRFAIPAKGDPSRALISPDGRRVAYTTGGTARSATATLWLQDLNRDEPQRVGGPGRLSLIDWSPDSQSIAYIDDGTLLRLPIDGRAATPIAALGFPFGQGSWSQDGATIVLSAPVGDSRLIAVQVHGGASRTIHSSVQSGFQGVYWQLQSLPTSDGTTKIVYVESEGDADHVVALDLDSGKRQVVAKGREPFYSRSGHLLYRAADQLWAAPFSVETLAATGPPIGLRHGGQFPSVSEDGTLVYVSRDGGLTQMVWKDRRGVELGSVGEPQPGLRRPRLSPDGRHIVVVLSEAAELASLWLHEISREAKTRFTFSPWAGAPTWRHDGKWIAYSPRGPAFVDIFLKPLDGSSDPRLVVSTPYPDFADSWSSDGRFLLFHRNTSVGDIWSVEFDEDGHPGAQTPLLASEFDEFSAQFSPDDRFFAYQSDRSGRHEIYVRAFPNSERDWIVSTGGGAAPKWRSDGRELFYVDLEGTLFAVPIEWSPEFTPGEPERLFHHDSFMHRGRRYDVTADGERFLVVKMLEDSRSTIRVVDDWFTELRELESEAQQR